MHEMRGVPVILNSIHSQNSAPGTKIDNVPFTILKGRSELYAPYFIEERESNVSKITEIKKKMHANYRKGTGPSRATLHHGAERGRRKRQRFGNLRGLRELRYKIIPKRLPGVIWPGLGTFAGHLEKKREVRPKLKGVRNGLFQFATAKLGNGGMDQARNFYVK